MKKKVIYAVGVDIGGTNTKLGITDSNGVISHFDSFPTYANGSDPFPYIGRLNNKINKLINSAPGPLIGIGISTHGYIDDKHQGPILCASTPSIRGFKLKDWAENTFNLPTTITNDSIAHSLAEYVFGSGKGSRRFLCMAIGTGFGVGVINNGKPLLLLGGTTGDAGRLILEPGGPKCNYLVSGSAEALLGVANIERLALTYYGYQKSAHQVISAAREGVDPIAIKIIQIIGGYLGHTLALLSALFLPEKVAITGGISEAGNILLTACRNQFSTLIGDYHNIIERDCHELYRGIEIVLGEFRGESGLLGATIELFQDNDLLY